MLIYWSQKEWDDVGRHTTVCATYYKDIVLRAASTTTTIKLLVHNNIYVTQTVKHDTSKCQGQGKQEVDSGWMHLPNVIKVTMQENTNIFNFALWHTFKWNRLS